MKFRAVTTLTVALVAGLLFATPSAAQSPDIPENVPHCGGYFLAPGRLPPELCPYDGPLKAGDSPTVLFLNFEGGTITRGGDDPENMTSWIPDYETVEITPFNHERYIDEALLPDRQAVIDAVVGWVRYYYGPFDITITSVRPAETPYQMMMVGGHASDITPNPGGMVGVSPFDCGNITKGDVNFCFSEDLSTMGDVVTTIVHEAGHSFGLAHVSNTAAVMNPYVTPDPFWDSGTVPDGAACDGGSSQDSFLVLAENLGETQDLEAPWVDFLNPGKGARVHPNLTVLMATGDEDSLGRWVELFVDGESKGEKKWPNFEWRINNMEDGKHTLSAVVRDYGANRSTTSITITVDAACAEGGSCTGGKQAISEECTKESSCTLGLCVRQINGDGAWCSTGCTPDTSACAPGMQCVLHENGVSYYCANGPGPVELKTDSGDHRLGCSATPGVPAALPFPMALLLLSLLWLRRRN